MSKRTAAAAELLDQSCSAVPAKNDIRNPHRHRAEAWFCSQAEVGMHPGAAVQWYQLAALPLVTMPPGYRRDIAIVLPHGTDCWPVNGHFGSITEEWSPPTQNAPCCDTMLQWWPHCNYTTTPSWNWGHTALVLPTQNTPCCNGGHTAIILPPHLGMGATLQ